MGEGFHSIDERDDGTHRQNCGQEVDRGAAVVAGLGQKPCPGDDDQDHNGDIDEKDAPPPEMPQEEAADERPQRRAPGGARGPDRDGGIAVAGIWEDVSDQRECRRHDGGSAEPQECTRDDEGGSAGREGRQHTGHPEAGGADEQKTTATDAVGDVAHGDEQTGQGEGVDVTDPQQLAGTGGQVGAQ